MSASRCGAGCSPRRPRSHRPDGSPSTLCLRRNRTLRIVRFAHTAAGAVYVQGEIPEAAVGPAEVDRLLGLLVDAADELRGALG